MEITFRDKTIIVTGAGSGIGRETARKFAEAGGNVACLDQNRSAVDEVVQDITVKGGHAKAFHVDIIDEAQVIESFRAVKSDFDSIDVLVNSAGIITFPKMDTLDTATWDRVINVNLRGTYFCSREAAAAMKEHRSGAIVNISAGAAKTGGMNPSPSYVASKGGINSLTLHFAVQLVKYGIRVNAICPGPIDTPMVDAQADLSQSDRNGKENIVAAVPLGLGKTEDIAYGALFLASNVWARYITEEILDINGGLVLD